jgi:3-phosphoinositide dependent protein kinase-1
MGEDYIRSKRLATFVGTAQYVSPEMLEDSDCGAPGDLWALGCMIYVMATSDYPFDDQSEYLIFERIKNLDIRYP